MNKYESDLLIALFYKSFINQRELSEYSKHSLGIVNKSLKSLRANGYVSRDGRLTLKAKEEVYDNAPKNAIILAAGIGMRMIPINSLSSKGLIEVNGEPLIERLIKQLHEVGVTDIIIVVGFMKEAYEYLIDKYNVELVVNVNYASKNNLSSLALVSDRISNTYIIPCDIWAEKNPFSATEMYSWYMVSDNVNSESDVRVNRKMELVVVSGNEKGNSMIGIAYLLEHDASKIRDKIKKLAADPYYNNDFWEVVLYSKEKMIISAKMVHSSDVVEINTYEQLRELDGKSNHLKSDALDVIAQVLSCSVDNIMNISLLKKGMTNRSFLFTVDDKKYIMRVPGEGTDKLINRVQEMEVFKTISGYGVCDDPVYIDKNGYKITEFLEGARVCNSEDEEDIIRCMEKLRSFHNQRLQVSHTFDIYGQIDFYEKLLNGIPSMYRDYYQTKENVESLKSFIENQPKDWCLTHIDAVPDNFLFYHTESGEQVQLTDWEYSGMQDPHVDLAMFSIYSFYDKKQIDHLLSIYFNIEPSHDIKAKIYCYVAACGLLWSNWAEYKSTLGVEFGEYGLRQYRYAKDFCNYAKQEMDLL